MVNKWLPNNQYKIVSFSCILCGCHNCDDKELCHDCTLELPWLNHTCPTCSETLATAESEGMVCGACQAEPPPYSLAKCLFAYRYPIDKLVTAFKFSAHLHHGRLFGELLADSMAEHYAQRNDLPECIVPVPLHRSRLRERGFNQAYEVARFCSRRLGVPLAAKLCERRKPTLHQPGLKPAARRSNLHNAFGLTATTLKAPPPSILLVDDVMTTGTTLRELATQFSKAGTRDIHVWCIARALTD